MNAAETTTGITAQIFPNDPGTNISGRNATIFVRMLKLMGIAMSRAPRTAASLKDLPFSQKQAQKVVRFVSD